MDRVTREAIDERLRVLEGVSGAVFRCIEDLMRVRSSLPPPTTAPGTFSSPAPSASSSSNTTGVDQPSITSASETLDEAIARAREVAENRSKFEEGMVTNAAQPVVNASSSSQPEESPLSVLQPDAS